MTRLFIGIADRTDDLPGHALAVCDDGGEVVEQRLVEPAGIEEALAALPGRPAVVALAGDIDVDAEGLAAVRGWTTAATNRGSVDWPACLRVDVRGRGAAYAARLAWQWHHDPGELTVLGDRRETYVVVATADLAEEIVVEIDPAQRAAVLAAIAVLPGVRAVR